MKTSESGKVGEGRTDLVRTRGEKCASQSEFATVGPHTLNQLSNLVNE
jgi:hypothetical protein